MQALSVDRGGDVLLLSLHGEIDFLNAAPVTDEIRQAVTQVPPAEVRVDLSEVTFLDSSGIGVLVTALRAAKEVSAAFRVDHPNPYILDQLDAAGLVELFGM